MSFTAILLLAQTADIRAHGGHAGPAPAQAEHSGEHSDGMPPPDASAIYTVGGGEAKEQPGAVPDLVGGGLFQPDASPAPAAQSGGHAEAGQHSAHGEHKKMPRLGEHEWNSSSRPGYGAAAGFTALAILLCGAMFVFRPGE